MISVQDDSKVAHTMTSMKDLKVICIGVRHMIDQNQGEDSLSMQEE